MIPYLDVLFKTLATKIIPALIIFWFVNLILAANQVEPNFAGLLSTAAAFGTVVVSIKFTGFP